MKLKANSMQAIQIGSHKIGDGSIPILWPDIDVYFKNDLDLALRMVETLRRAGVRVIKGAVIQHADHCLNTDITTEYFVAGKGMVIENYRRVIERHVVGLPVLRRIYGKVRELGLDIILSVYDDEGIKFAEEMDAAGIKIPSSNIVHAPLIRSAVSTGRPVIIDTGRSAMCEIERAVHWARSAGAERLLIQHSPPGPPAPPAESCLSMMPELGRRFDLPYGLSDHSQGTQIMLLATALGASVLEKGICADNASADIDIAHALPVSDVEYLLEQIAQVHAAIGHPAQSISGGMKRPQDRMGVIAARDLHPGEILTLEVVRFAFPTIGVPVEDWDSIAGHQITRFVEAGVPITLAHLALNA